MQSRVIPLLLAVVATVPAQGTQNGGSQVRVLVKADSDLTPATVASIGSLAQETTFVWPEIRALALRIRQQNLAALAAHPAVAFIEVDHQIVLDPDSDLRVNGAASGPAAGTFGSGGTDIPWNQDMADTAGSGYDGSGVTIAVLDSGLPPDFGVWLPAAQVDLTYATGFGTMGDGSSQSGLNANTGNGSWFGLYSHGLAMTSVITGFRDYFGDFRGAAPGATVVPIRVLNGFNSGFFSWSAAGILYVAGLKSSGALTTHPRAGASQPDRLV
jgi:hypothetical protein